VQSRACLDLGPPDRDHRQLFASGAGKRVRGSLPPGVALRLAPVPATPGGPPDGLGILLDGEWTNSTSRARRASAVVVLHRARPSAVGRIAQPIFERSAELGLEVPPGAVRSTEDSTAALNAAHPGSPAVRDAWGAGITTLGGSAPTGASCVVLITGHMHKHGRFLGVDLLGPDGLPANPPGGVPNPFEAGRTHLFGAFDYTDPGVLAFSPPRLLPADGALHYACWDDNGVANSVQLGCEESAGVAPGTALGMSGAAPRSPAPPRGRPPPSVPSRIPRIPRGPSPAPACPPRWWPATRRTTRCARWRARTTTRSPGRPRARSVTRRRSRRATEVVPDQGRARRSARSQSATRPAASPDTSHGPTQTRPHTAASCQVRVSTRASPSRS